ncbi:hypothetical protein QFC20_005306 [Naganishia adeliensis]|uniref:Uncharacterized protein n=1 Tax=Naganishia adeliensis TaxID=92952 RepID=A0ACC2VQ32_9TREE|nr:hypothetical protein QFC20_005306 [Naganishia adeliensis]
MPPTPKTPPEVAKYFSDPAAKVVFKTSDGVNLRVEDFILKASSIFFRDMLTSSTPSSSQENPLPIDEDSNVFITVLLIVTGHAQEAIAGPDDWTQAKKLYLIMQKYQLDIHQAWFSEMCSRRVIEKPLEALFLACNQPYIDTTLARAAICDGMANSSPAKLFDKSYFVHETSQYSGYPMDSPSNPFKLDLLNTRNTTIKFGIKLGFKGLLAYNATFTTVSSSTPTTSATWYDLAAKFVTNVRQVERDMQDAVSAYLLLAFAIH